MKGTTTAAARSEANGMPKPRAAQRLVRAAAVILYLLAFTTVPATAQYYDPYGRYQGSRSFFGYGRPSGGPSTVDFPAHHKPGTILISTSQRRLYLMLGNGQALQYPIGVGRIGFTWNGVTRVSAKREWPSWTPPAEMRRRRPDLPRHMAGGMDNPLGARALYLGSTLYRIHGSNEPETIGQAVSSGCFRMSNEDVVDLYNRVPVGATVIVQH